MKYSALFALTACSLTPMATLANTPEPLRILVVSDDGCKSEGSQALFNALNKQGYDVWLSGPLNNQSGMGTAVTFKIGKQLNYEKIADKQYCFDGTPVDSVLFGLTALMADQKPDLVISGVNDGPNVGVNQFNSGTVSAAARAVRHGIPALAVSMGFRLEEANDGFPSSFEYIPAAVKHTLEVVDKLNKQHKAGNELLPKGTGLSINYPPYPKSELKGIEYVANEEQPDYNYFFKLAESGKTVQELNFEPFKQASDESITNDTTQLMRKHITYTVFQAHWNAPQWEDEYQAILK
ncbi:5'/3'-nucleotidase SurE [Vibrio sp. VPAP30]|uniref:5'/3'-nucleotidase SurE n=1 Tax=Vibrio sp. VPAP30 TaxID=1647102 RepID=UPI0006764EAF|nr:5'/3'-nucleotidase SurE [Vibrio sp. VPAP30]